MKKSLKLSNPLLFSNPNIFVLFSEIDHP